MRSRSHPRRGSRRGRWALAALAILCCAPPLAAQEGLGVDALLLAGEPAGAPLSGPELERATEELASVMRCPVCQGLSVADSPTESATNMKRQVRDLLARGYTAEQVLDYFERSYGEFIRLVPKRRGFNLTVWLAPLAGLAAGALLVVRRLRRGPRPGGAAAAGAELAPYLERVRREVGG